MYHFPFSYVRGSRTFRRSTTSVGVGRSSSSSTSSGRTVGRNIGEASRCRFSAETGRTKAESLAATTIALTATTTTIAATTAASTTTIASFPD